MTSIHIYSSGNQRRGRTAERFSFWGFGWLRLRRFGARAIGGACHTSPGRTADSIRLGGHRSHIGRCVPRERGAAAGNASRIIDDAQSSHNDRHPESFRLPSF